jgi:hypothetical protein
MTVAELISILQQQDPRAAVVIPDSDEEDRWHITELRAEHVRACAIRYPHPDRAPRFTGAGISNNAVYICTVSPATGYTL